MTNFNSSIISDREDTSRQVEVQAHGEAKKASTFVELAGAAALDDILVLFEVPVDANITSYKHHSDDLGTSGEIDFGIYPGNIKPADLVATDAIDQDLLGTMIVASTVQDDVEIRYETLDINTTGKKLWELAGETSKPEYGTYFLCGTISEATTTGGTVAGVMEYV